MNRTRTIREEANALTCYAFRNGKLEALHAGEWSELLTNPTLSRITNDEMKELMIEASENLARALFWKESDPERYWNHINKVCDTYAMNWVKDEPAGVHQTLREQIVSCCKRAVDQRLGRSVSTEEIEQVLGAVAERPSCDLTLEGCWERWMDEVCDELRKRGSPPSSTDNLV